MLVPAIELEAVVEECAKLEASGASFEEVQALAKEGVVKRLMPYLATTIEMLSYERCDEMRAAGQPAAAQCVSEAKPQVEPLCHDDTADDELNLGDLAGYNAYCRSFTGEERTDLGFPASCDDCDEQECFSESVIPNCDMACAALICTEFLLANSPTMQELRGFALSVVITRLAHYIADDLVETAMQTCSVESLVKSDDFKAKWAELSALDKNKKNLDMAKFVFAELVSVGLNPEVAIEVFSEHIANQRKRGIHPRFCTSLYDWFDSMGDVLLAISHDRSSDINF